MMTPALGFFYGGMVRSKNALNTLMMSFSALGFVGLTWAFFGYSVAFGTSSNWCGGSAYFFLRGVGLSAQGSIPHVLFFSYQGTFAIITAALISGAIVERMRFGPYLAFVALWSLVVYAPIAHWVWGDGHRRRTRRHHTRRRICESDEWHHHRSDRGISELLRARVSRDNAARRFARCRGGARRRRHRRRASHRRVRIQSMERDRRRWS